MYRFKIYVDGKIEVKGESSLFYYLLAEAEHYFCKYKDEGKIKLVFEEVKE